MAFRKPHSVRRGNRLILQVQNCGNLRIVIHLFDEELFHASRTMRDRLLL